MYVGDSRLGRHIAVSALQCYIYSNKHMTRNSILGIYGSANLAQVTLINFGLIQFSTIPGMKLLSCPGQFILWQQSGSKARGERTIP